MIQRTDEKRRINIDSDSKLWDDSQIKWKNELKQSENKNRVECRPRNKLSKLDEIVLQIIIISRMKFTQFLSKDPNVAEWSDGLYFDTKLIRKRTFMGAIKIN